MKTVIWASGSGGICECFWVPFHGECLNRQNIQDLGGGSRLVYPDGISDLKYARKLGHMDFWPSKSSSLLNLYPPV